MLWRIPDAGGDERDRTADPLLAKQVLSHLSYIPTLDSRCTPRGAGLALSGKTVDRRASDPCVVGLPGIEPGTSRLSSVRSSQLS